VASRTVSCGLRRHGMAARVRWPGRLAHLAGDRRRRDGAGQLSIAYQRPGHRDRRADASRSRHRALEAALPQEDPHGGRDHGLLLARTNSTARKHHGISCSLINMRQPGIAVRPVRQITAAKSSPRCPDAGHRGQARPRGALGPGLADRGRRCHTSGARPLSRG
jgi:hypothetical protein